MKDKTNWTVRRAVSSDLTATKALADAHKRELGFILRPVLEQAIQQGEVLVAANGVDMLGFVHFHHRRDEQTTLYNIVVDPEHRRRGVGKRLLESLVNECREREKSFILLRCPEDLAANKFYERSGCTIIGTEASKRRRLIVWRRKV